MSTNIYSAWKLYDNTSIRSLVVLAHNIKAIQDASYTKEVAASVFQILDGFKYGFYSHFHNEEERQKASIVMAASIQPIMFRYWDNPVFIFPQEERFALKNALRKHSDTVGLDATEEMLDDMSMVATAIYERYSRSHPSLVFLSDSWAEVYLKGFGLTNAVENYLNEQFPSFDYTDATDMPLGAFPAGEHLIKVIKTEEERDQMAALLQQERGRIWDDVLNGHTNFKDAGLLFSLHNADELTMRANLRKVVSEFFALEEKEA